MLDKIISYLFLLIIPILFCSNNDLKNKLEQQNFINNLERLYYKQLITNEPDLNYEFTYPNKNINIISAAKLLDLEDVIPVSHIIETFNGTIIAKERIIFGLPTYLGCHIGNIEQLTLKRLWFEMDNTFKKYFQIYSDKTSFGKLLLFSAVIDNHDFSDNIVLQHINNKITFKLTNTESDKVDYELLKSIGSFDSSWINSVFAESNTLLNNKIKKNWINKKRIIDNLQKYRDIITLSLIYKKD